MSPISRATLTLDSLAAGGPYAGAALSCLVMVLTEDAAELVLRVAESELAAGDATPLYFHRPDDGVENPERVPMVKAVGDCENVEHGADIVHKQPRSSTRSLHLPPREFGLVVLQGNVVRKFREVF